MYIFDFRWRLMCNARTYSIFSRSHFIEFSKYVLFCSHFDSYILISCEFVLDFEMDRSIKMRKEEYTHTHTHATHTFVHMRNSLSYFRTHLQEEEEEEKKQQHQQHH